MLFLASKEHIKNPYLRSKLVEVLYEFSPDAERDQLRGASSGFHTSTLPIIFEQIGTNPLAVKYLTPALVRMYVDIETTGRMYLL